MKTYMKQKKKKKITSSGHLSKSYQVLKFEICKNGSNPVVVSKFDPFQRTKGI